MSQIDQVNAVLDFIFTQFGSIVTLYRSFTVLTAVIALWLFSKVINIIRRVLP